MTPAGASSKSSRRGPAAACVRDAWERRQALHEAPDVDVYRLFHGHSEGLLGCNIERFADVAIVSCTGAPVALIEEIADTLTGLHPFAAVVAKETGGRESPVTVVRGDLTAAAAECVEHGLRYAFDASTGANAGLYLDGRPARRWILDHVRERRVLNLFAHTGSLGVAAAVGGAASVVHVETQPRKRRIIRDNHRRNAVPIDARDVVGEDVYRYLRRAAAAGSTFDAVILDPPPIPQRRRRGVRPPAQDHGTLVPLATAVLAAGGWLLCFQHRQGATSRADEARLLDAAGPRWRPLWRGQSGPDFPESDASQKLRFLALTGL